MNTTRIDRDILQRRRIYTEILLQYIRHEEENQKCRIQLTICYIRPGERLAQSSKTPQFPSELCQLVVPNTRGREFESKIHDYTSRFCQHHAHARDFHRNASHRAWLPHDSNMPWYQRNKPNLSLQSPLSRKLNAIIVYFMNSFFYNKICPKCCKTSSTCVCSVNLYTCQLLLTAYTRVKH